MVKFSQRLMKNILYYSIEIIFLPEVLADELLHELDIPRAVSYIDCLQSSPDNIIIQILLLLFLLLLLLLYYYITDIILSFKYL